MDDFTYHAPATVAEALALRAEGGGAARYLAGGSDLLLAMQRAEPPVARVIDLKGIAALREIRVAADGGVALGAAVTMAAIERHAHLLAHYPALVAAAAAVGGPPIRNRATVGGNVCNASPAADTSPVLLALGARAVIAGGGGERELPLAELWSGPGRLTLLDGELLTAVRLPALPPRTGCGFQRLTRAAMDIALVSAAAVCTLDRGDRITAAACALGAVAPTVLAVAGLGAALAGSRADAGTLARVEHLAAAAARPIDDHRASAAYRREMAGVMARRAMAEACDRARATSGGAA
ncbi:MAG: FAD binding domain-containing protein [Candidatus Lambdaproteobacteria bacterium]|nr:FAD binding domain-containing protein [Candidatus Lambdaproteobacteria bacterium]